MIAQTLVRSVVHWLVHWLATASVCIDQMRTHSCTRYPAKEECMAHLRQELANAAFYPHSLSMSSVFVLVSVFIVVFVDLLQPMAWTPSLVSIACQNSPAGPTHNFLTMTISFQAIRVWHFCYESDDTIEMEALQDLGGTWTMNQFVVQTRVSSCSDNFLRPRESITTSEWQVPFGALARTVLKVALWVTHGSLNFEQAFTTGRSRFPLQNRLHPEVHDAALLAAATPGLSLV